MFQLLILLTEQCVVHGKQFAVYFCCIITVHVSSCLHKIIFILHVSREVTPVCCGDVVHLEGRCDGGSWLVDREQGFLVLLPDSLVSGTSISNSIRCMRRAVLGDLFKVKDTNTLYYGGYGSEKLTLTI